MNGKNPFVERNFGALKHGSDSDGERAGAVIALVDAGAGALAFQLRDFARAATMGANRPIRPAILFHVLTALLSVLVNRVRYVHNIALLQIRNVYML